MQKTSFEETILISRTNSRDIRAEVQFSRLDMNITGQNIVEYNILDEVVLVVLLIIILLDAGQSDSQYARILCSHFVSAFNEYSIIGLHVSAERLVGVARHAQRYHGSLPRIERNELISCNLPVPVPSRRLMVAVSSITPITQSIVSRI